MPKLLKNKYNLTIKQEGFCQTYIENDGNATEAYVDNYNTDNMKRTTITRKATELMANGIITARVDQLKERALSRHDITVDTLSIELEEARTVANAEKQASAMVSATMGKAKLHGLGSEKVKHEGNVTFAGLLADITGEKPE